MKIYCNIVLVKQHKGGDNRLKFDSGVPIYLQIMEKIKLDIIIGKYKLGDRLPSVRELAALYKVNPNTVQKALSLLEEEKLIYTERTTGKFITDDKNKILATRKELANNLTTDYVKAMKNLNLTTKEIIKYIEGCE